MSGSSARPAGACLDPGVLSSRLRVRCEGRPRPVNQGNRRGQDDVGLLACFEASRSRSSEVFDAGDEVLVVTAIQGRGKASGAEVSNRLPRSGPSVTARSSASPRFTDRRRALEAAGLRSRRCRRRTSSSFSPGSNAGTEASGTFRRMSCTRTFRSSAAFKASRSRVGRDCIDGCGRSTSSFAEWKLAGDEWRETRDRVVVLGRVRLRRQVERCHRRSTARMGVRLFRDGKVFRFRHFARPQEALEAAGLSE